MDFGLGIDSALSSVTLIIPGNFRPRRWVRGNGVGISNLAGMLDCSLPVAIRRVHTGLEEKLQARLYKLESQTTNPEQTWP